MAPWWNQGQQRWGAQSGKGGQPHRGRDDSASAPTTWQSDGNGWQGGKGERKGSGKGASTTLMHHMAAVRSAIEEQRELASMAALFAARDASQHNVWEDSPGPAVAQPATQSASVVEQLLAGIQALIRTPSEAPAMAEQRSPPPRRSPTPPTHNGLFGQMLQMLKGRAPRDEADDGVQMCGARRMALK